MGNQGAVIWIRESCAAYFGPHSLQVHFIKINWFLAGVGNT